MRMEIIIKDREAESIYRDTSATTTYDVGRCESKLYVLITDRKDNSTTFPHKWILLDNPIEWVRSLSGNLNEGLPAITLKDYLAPSANNSTPGFIVSILRDLGIICADTEDIVDVEHAPNNFFRSIQAPSWKEQISQLVTQEQIIEVRIVDREDILN